MIDDGPASERTVRPMFRHFRGMLRTVLSTATMTLAVSDTWAQVDLPTWPCHFTSAAVIGCVGVDPEEFETPVELFQKFGFDAARIAPVAVHQALAALGCRVIKSDPNSKWRIYARGPIRLSTLDGPAEVFQVDLRDVGAILIVDGRYLQGKCPLPPPLMPRPTAP